MAAYIGITAQFFIGINFLGVFPKILRADFHRYGNIVNRKNNFPPLLSAWGDKSKLFNYSGISITVKVTDCVPVPVIITALTASSVVITKNPVPLTTGTE